MSRAYCRGQARRRRPDARRWRSRPAKTGVTVNAVCPGFVETAMLEASVERIVAQDRPHAPSRARASLAAANPQGRFIQPEEVAAAVLWLCSRGGALDHRPGDLGLGRRDMVSAAAPAPALDDGKQRLRLWLRLLRASRTIEAELRERLSTEFDTTLPRFDVMAALYRAPDGMLMSELSRVPAGLQRQRHRHHRPAGVGRPASARPARRRPPHVRSSRLTPSGRRRFRRDGRARTKPGSTSCSAMSAKADADGIDRACSRPVRSPSARDGRRT